MSADLALAGVRVSADTSSRDTRFFQGGGGWLAEVPTAQSIF